MSYDIDEHYRPLGEKEFKDFPNGAGFKPEIEDVPRQLECGHCCTSNCRRNGCKCKCGELHNEDGIYNEYDETPEE